jgi:hypothetical protein
MFKRSYYALLFSLVFCMNAFGTAADLTGDWYAKMESPQDTVTYLFKFDVKGDSFTGTVKIKNKKEEGAGEITQGKIDGDRIAFTLHVPIAGTPSTVAATGTVTGNEMKLTIEGEDPHDGHRKMQLKLSRVAVN